MKRRSGLLVATAVLVAVLGAGGLYGGVLGELRSGGGTATAASRPALDADPLTLPLAGGTAATVARLEREVRGNPGDAGRLGELGLAYQLRWRETGTRRFCRSPSVHSRPRTMHARTMRAQRSGWATWLSSATTSVARSPSVAQLDAARRSPSVLTASSATR